MMTACDLSAITKPWEVQSKVWSPPDLRRGESWHHDGGLDSEFQKQPTSVSSAKTRKPL